MGTLGGILILLALVVFFYLVGKWEIASYRRDAAKVRLGFEERPDVARSAADWGVANDVPAWVIDGVLNVLVRVSDFSTGLDAGHVRPARLLPADTLGQDLGYHLDSLAFFELNIGIEKEFGMGLPGGAWKDVVTVGDVVRMVAARIRSRPPRSWTLWERLRGWGIWR